MVLLLEAVAAIPSLKKRLETETLLLAMPSRRKPRKSMEARSVKQGALGGQRGKVESGTDGEAATRLAFTLPLPYLTLRPALALRVRTPHWLRRHDVVESRKSGC